MLKKTTESCWCASDRAHNRRYDAVWDTVPSVYSMVSITWWMVTSMMSNSSSSSSSGQCKASSSPSDMGVSTPRLAEPKPPGPRVCKRRATSALCCIIMMSGFGISITGTQSMVITIKSRGKFSPNIGFGSSVHMAMEIRELMTLGGFSIGVTHLWRIMRSMKPKKLHMKTIMGTHSQKKSTKFRKCKAFKKRSSKPTSMCVTPRMTESFIFKEFMNTSSFCAPCQAGSTPKG
mmetsp:Transcript_111904/g.311489  ORF Transcript_111904/g.311489 Transcript_111904/m.311489 type:complete len:233 (+) Transcript_111904:310-1008(+)